MSRDSARREDDSSELLEAALSSGQPLREIEDYLDCLENERTCSGPRRGAGARGLGAPAPPTGCRESPVGGCPGRLQSSGGAYSRKAGQTVLGR